MQAHWKGLEVQARSQIQGRDQEDSPGRQRRHQEDSLGRQGRRQEDSPGHWLEYPRRFRSCEQCGVPEGNEGTCPCTGKWGPHGHLRHRCDRFSAVHYTKRYEDSV